MIKMNHLCLLTVLLLVFLALGCARLKLKSPAAKPAAAPAKIVVTADLSLGAKVVSVNPVGRFVVLSFPTGDLSKVPHTLYLYRSGLKVATVNITGPQQGNIIVADVISGEARDGDTARQR